MRNGARTADAADRRSTLLPPGPGRYPPRLAMADETARLASRAREVLGPLSGEHPFTPRFLAVRGHSMHHVDEGPGDAAGERPGVVLCVHGNPTWSFYWRRIVEALSPEARVVAPDHLGMGLSSRVPGGVRLAEHVDGLVTLIDQLELDDITLVCHDWGGAIGFGAVLARRERFRSLVVTNTAAFPSSRIPRRIAACRIPLLGRVGVQGGNAFARAALHMTTARPLAKSARDGLIAPYDGWANREQVWRFVKDIPMRPAHPSWAKLCEISDGLESLRGLPMEIVWGMQDWCFSPEFKSTWEQRFPEAHVTELADAGHYVNEDAPEAVIAAIRRVRAVDGHAPALEGARA